MVYSGSAMASTHPCQESSSTCGVSFPYGDGIRSSGVGLWSISSPAWIDLVIASSCGG